MATPADDSKKAAAKKAAKKTTKTASKTVAKKATKAPAKTATKKAAKAPTAAKARADKPLEFDFSDQVQVASSDTAKSSAPKADGFNKAKEHAGRAFEEIATAAVVGFDHVSKKLDAASIKAQREAKEALKKGEKWVREHPVAASVAGSAVAGTVTAGLKKLFKR